MFRAVRLANGAAKRPATAETALADGATGIEALLSDASE